MNKTPDNSNLKFAVIILAAGSSSRFEGNKLLASIQGKAVIDYCIDAFFQMKSDLDPVIIVLGGYQDQLRKHLTRKGIKFTYNKRFETEGMMSSIKQGLKKLRKLPYSYHGVFIHPGDIPFILPEDLIQITKLMIEEDFPIVVPFHNSHRGHPVLIRRDYLEKLEMASDDSLGLRGFLDDNMSNVGLVNTENEGVLKDIDYQSDIEGLNSYEM